MTPTRVFQLEIADLLYQHTWQGDACECGWKNIDDDHVDHLAQLLLVTYDISRCSQ